MGWNWTYVTFRVILARMKQAACFKYKTLSGQPSSSLLWQMVQHVVNHASYHRGQVTNMLRQIGAAPPLSTDRIAYYRLQEKELARQKTPLTVFTSWEFEADELDCAASGNISGLDAGQNTDWL